MSLPDFESYQKSFSNEISDYELIMEGVVSKMELYSI